MKIDLSNIQIKSNNPFEIKETQNYINYNNINEIILPNNSIVIDNSTNKITLQNKNNTEFTKEIIIHNCFIKFEIQLYTDQEDQMNFMITFEHLENTNHDIYIEPGKLKILYEDFQGFPHELYNGNYENNTGRSFLIQDNVRNIHLEPDEANGCSNYVIPVNYFITKIDYSKHHFEVTERHQISPILSQFESYILNNKQYLKIHVHNFKDFFTFYVYGKKLNSSNYETIFINKMNEEINGEFIISEDPSNFYNDIKLSSWVSFRYFNYPPYENELNNILNPKNIPLNINYDIHNQKFNFNFSNNENNNLLKLEIYKKDNNNNEIKLGDFYNYINNTDFNISIPIYNNIQEDDKFYYKLYNEFNLDYKSGDYNTPYIASPPTLNNINVTNTNFNILLDQNNENFNILIEGNVDDSNINGIWEIQNLKYYINIIDYNNNIIYNNYTINIPLIFTENYYIEYINIKEIQIIRKAKLYKNRIFYSDIMSDITTINKNDINFHFIHT